LKEELIDLPNKDLFTPTESARFLGVSVSTIYNWISNKYLPAARTGKRLQKIKRADLLKIVTPCGDQGVEWGEDG